MNEVDEQTPTRLANMPVAFFAVVMGLSGLTMAWDMAERATIMPFNASPYHAVITGAVFLVLLVFYAAKYFLHRGHVMAELNHPVQLAFFPTITISMLLISVIVYDYNIEIAKYIWLVGAAAHLFMTYYVLAAWMGRGHYEIQHLNPAWFIPVVGNIIAPIGGMQHGYVDVSWFFFSVGLVFWLVLMVIVFYRIIFHHPIGERLVPTFFILIAPPAVGFISYVTLTGSVDAFATILFNTALFLTLMQASQFVRFMQLQFYLSWWAYSFPLAAITIASFLMAELSGKDWYFIMAMGMFVILNMVLAYLTVRTIEAMLNNRICVTEGPQGT